MTLGAVALALLGGLGLFLLGMWLMTEGLKLAAGNALRRILERGTKTPLRALASGVGLTATVQSSSAVTVATVGFVNAGLLTLGQAVWVVYGANIGTTMTGWIVALTGVELKLDSYALPLIGAAMLLRLSGLGTARAAYGQALAGFAVFLLGIHALKTHFSALAAAVDFAALPQQGWAAAAAYFAIGTALTLLIQSSSATTAIVIAAAAAGVVPVAHAALVIVGADLGTSATAGFAAFGATANARRTAASHVLFNLVTTLFAVATLPLLLVLVEALRERLRLPADPGITLALFATTFNVLGVLLMAPLTAPMVAFLKRRFRSREDDLAQPRHLDRTSLEVPALAARGLALELQRLGRLTLALALDAIARTPPELAGLMRREEALALLAEHIRRYVGRLQGAPLPPPVAQGVVPLLRALQHYEEIADLAVAGPPVAAPEAPALRTLRRHLDDATRQALAAADTADPAYAAARLAARAAEAETAYEALKAGLLHAAAGGGLPVAEMDAQMQDAARLHRTVERASKAALRLAAAGREPPDAEQSVAPNDP